MRAFGVFIRQRRRELGLGQREVARALSLSVSRCAQIESGYSNRLSAVQLIALAERLGLDIGEVVELRTFSPAQRSPRCSFFPRPWTR